MTDGPVSKASFMVTLAAALSIWLLYENYPLVAAFAGFAWGILVGLLQAPFVYRK